MHVVKATKEHIKKDESAAPCNVHVLHVKVKDVKGCAQHMMKAFKDTSWIEKLNAVDQISIKARSDKTIKKLVSQILANVEDRVTEDFGEYLVSYYGQKVLVDELKHIEVPLPEFWKEKITGNPGFDFHTETDGNIIAFGEAKYNSSKNPYPEAIGQIIKFVKDNKAEMELRDIQMFVTPFSVERFTNGFKAFVAAFSLKAKNPETVFSNIVKSDQFKELLIHSEIYIVGVEVDA